MVHCKAKEMLTRALHLVTSMTGHKGRGRECQDLTDKINTVTFSDFDAGI